MKKDGVLTAEIGREREREGMSETLILIKNEGFPFP